jgi:hypothetical protein
LCGDAKHSAVPMRLHDVEARPTGHPLQPADGHGQLRTIAC